LKKSDRRDQDQGDGRILLSVPQKAPEGKKPTLWGENVEVLKVTSPLPFGKRSQPPAHRKNTERFSQKTKDQACSKRSGGDPVSSLTSSGPGPPC